VSVPLLPRRPRLQSRKDRPGRSFLFLSSSLGRFGTCAYSLYAGPFRPRGPGDASTGWIGAMGTSRTT
jgi:hypothetical protein